MVGWGGRVGVPQGGVVGWGGVFDPYVWPLRAVFASHNPKFGFRSKFQPPLNLTAPYLHLPPPLTPIQLFPPLPFYFFFSINHPTSQQLLYYNSPPFSFFYLLSILFSPSPLQHNTTQHNTTQFNSIQLSLSISLTSLFPPFSIPYSTLQHKPFITLFLFFPPIPLSPIPLSLFSITTLNHSPFSKSFNITHLTISLSQYSISYFLFFLFISQLIPLLSLSFLYHNTSLSSLPFILLPFTLFPIPYLSLSTLSPTPTTPYPLTLILFSSSLYYIQPLIQSQFNNPPLYPLTLLFFLITYNL